MADRSTTPVRRAQLVAPFGVGAMMTNQNGISMICASLDHWYSETAGRTIDESEFIVDEWRLRERLAVHHFRLPPDFRRKGDQNTFISVPAFRFPQWHFCPTCDRMHRLPLTTRDEFRCPYCERQGKRIEMYQVRFVMICDHGHLHDFPWREWVHRDPNPACEGVLRLDAKGGASLSSIFVRCDCGAWRSLDRITTAEPENDNTHLSRELAPGQTYTCPGAMPWAGADAHVRCDRPVRGSLRNASNVYFAEVRSSLYLPRIDEHGMQELIELLGKPKFSLIRSLVTSGSPPSEMLGHVKNTGGLAVKAYADEQLVQALNIVCNGTGGIGAGDNKPVASDTPETAYRRAEFNVLRCPRTSDRLTIRDPGQENYEPDLQAHFSRIMLVDRLRETRALTGFTRIYPEGGPDLTPAQKRALLWRDPPHPGSDRDWLPVTVVHGEGIFLEFNGGRLQAWEQRDDVKEQFGRLNRNFSRSRHYDPEHLAGPRFVLIHTFAHLLMNQLIFECGYSSAALRERLYISTDPDAPMAGLLIYTAAGDSDGTMGGLVRMGKPGNLEPVIRRALAEATWCSADPICMEAAERGGQGPDSCNLAACHNCALVPETSCEEFNRFLDRGHVIGIGGSSESSYFKDLLP